MNEIERMNPGLVVRAGYRPPVPVRRSVALTGKTKRAVLAELSRRQRRGEIESAGVLQFITTGELAGRYAIRVVMLPARQDPRWARTMVSVGSFMIGLAALVFSIGWFLTALSTGAMVVVCIVPVALLGVWVKVKYARPSVTINQTVNVGR